MLKKLKRIQKAALEVAKLSQQTIAIMKSYNKPPDVVTQVRIINIGEQIYVPFKYINLNINDFCNITKIEKKDHYIR